MAIDDEKDQSDDQQRAKEKPRFTLIKATEPLSDEELNTFFAALGIDPEMVPADEDEAERWRREGRNTCESPGSDEEDREPKSL